MRNDSVPQRKDHEEPGPAKLRRHAGDTQSEDSKESDEGEKESGDSETIQPGEKKECLEPSIVKAAWVYSQSAHAHQVLPVDVGETQYSSWYPCLVAYNTSDPGYQNVLCKPLLEIGCKNPFRTHESRLVHINSHAPHPQNFDHSEEVIEPQPEHFERSTVTIEEVIEDTVTIEEVIKDDAWRNYRWGWWKTCPDWARFVEELHDHEDEKGLP